MNTSPLATTLWTAGVLMLALILRMMRERRLFREFPVFGTYVVYNLIAELIGGWVRAHGSLHEYFDVFWGNEIINSAFALLVIREVFAKVLAPYPGLRSIGFKIYATGAVLFIAISVWIANTAPQVVVARVTTSLIVGERSSSFVQIGLLFLLFLFCRLFGLTWRNYSFGIVLGFAIWATAEIIASSLRVQAGFAGSRLYSVLAQVSGDLAPLVWSFYFVKKESEVRVPEVPLSLHLARWNAALEALLAR